MALGAIPIEPRKVGVIAVAKNVRIITEDIFHLTMMVLLVLLEMVLHARNGPTRQIINTLETRVVTLILIIITAEEMVQETVHGAIPQIRVI